MASFPFDSEFVLVMRKFFSLRMELREWKTKKWFWSVFQNLKLDKMSMSKPWNFKEGILNFDEIVLQSFKKVSCLVNLFLLVKRLAALVKRQKIKARIKRLLRFVHFQSHFSYFLCVLYSYSNCYRLYFQSDVFLHTHKTK